MFFSFFVERLVELSIREGWIPGECPDDPRLAKRSLVVGVVLCLAFIIPTRFAADWGFRLLLFFEFLCLIFGVICLLFGAFILLRRAAWRRPEKAGLGLTDLGAGERNNSAAAHVSKLEADEYISGSSPD